MSKTANLHKSLLFQLTTLLVETEKAKSKLSNIDGHLAIALGAVNKSCNYSDNGSPTFTPEFEIQAISFHAAVQELGNVLLPIFESLEEIEKASEQIVVGVNTKLFPTKAS